MAENRSYIQRYAMLFGTYMGIYWIIGSVFFPLGLRNPLLLLLFMILVIAGPFIGYRYVRTYRNAACEGCISFSHAWVFTTLMYVFASLLAAAAHYIYFRFIDQGFIINTYTDMVNEVFSTNVTVMPEIESYREKLETACEQLASLTPIEITMQIFSNNIFWGILLGIPTALCVMRRRKGNSSMLPNSSNESNL